MNTIFKAALLLSVSWNLIHANPDVTDLLIEAPSAQNVEQAKAQFIECQSQRDNAQFATGGAFLLAGGLYLAYRNLKKPLGAEDMDAVNKTYNLANRVLALEAALKTNEEKAIADAGWGSWLASNAKWAGGCVLGFGFMIGKHLITLKLLADGSRFLHSMFPQVGKLTHYLFASHTIVWCMETHTSFYGALGQLMNSTRQIADEPAQMLTSKANVSVALKFFIRETEIIMGYMRAVADQIDSEDPHAKVLADHIHSTTLMSLERLVLKANEFLTAEDNLPRMKTALTKEFKDGAYTIISQFERFQDVQVSAGYDDTRESKTFTNLKVYVNPEEQLLLRAAGESDELLQLARQLLNHVL